MTELVTITAHTNSTGPYNLSSEIFRGTVQYIRIPKGMKLKVWCKRVSGADTTFGIEVTRDITANTPVWQPISIESYSGNVEFALEKRRPIIIRGRTGREAVRLNRVSGSGDSYIDLEVEFAEDV